jgi:chromosome segregation ATPase
MGRHGEEPALLGGANPELIARDLEKALRDGKRADAALEAALREANGRVEDVRSRLSAIERAKEGLATEAAALAQLEAEAQRLEAERDAAARERDRAAAATRYREDRGILADMESLEALRSRPASKDETQALRSLKEEASRAAAAFAEAKTAEQLARRAHAALSERRSRAEAALAAAEPGARLARDWPAFWSGKT